MYSFQYTPSELRTILFPPATDTGRPRKRKRSPLRDASPPSSSSATSDRDVVVETSCERFFIAVEDESGTEAVDDAPSKQRYLVALVPSQRGVGGKSAIKQTETSDTLTPAAKDDAAASEVSTSHPEKAKEAEGADKAERMAVDDSDKSKTTSDADKPPAKAQRSPSSPSPSPASSRLQILHRNLTLTNFDFTKDGLDILSDAVEANGVRKGWRMEAKTWRWCSKRESEAWRKEVKEVS